ncbi:winged helix-turn-helix domain-containing protein [Pseudonocardia abyssalis]|uniref:Winged helix-turn-helix transcriptional regulator n=1 Tax=Pseudonocardia abyssalis TaxID=2792008 RepID=A0ABS6UXF6_9PSEU|nr:winged helix-turn-helix transcriptional regulator [Pseudonocardia abyssalis]MBW0136661.1 winged helix-turn-helix transcriptional regulator [Pseudonocardia abyssalis]
MAPRGSYLQIADELRRRLAGGELQPGSMLPSEQALAHEFSVSRGTARSAFAVLAEEGLIEVLPGQGRRIAGSVDSAPRAPTTAWEKVAADLRGRLQADPGSRALLPSEAELAAEHGVSRNTVRRAYRQLVEEGLVVVRHGSGAFPAHRRGASTAHDR